MSLHSVALLLFKIVASIYNPFSVKTLGRVLLLVDHFAVENFDRKTADSSKVNETPICLCADVRSRLSKVDGRPAV